MQYQQWTEECRFLLDWFHQVLHELQESIKQGSGFASFQEWPEPAITDTAARQRIARYYGEISRKNDDQELEEKQFKVFAAVAVDEAGRHAAEQLNIVKTEFREFHENVRSAFPDRVKATDGMRLILKNCGHARLNLDAIDRQIPIVKYPTNKLSWGFNRSSVSRQRTIADALRELRKLQDTLGEYIHDTIEADIRRIEQEYPDTSHPVSQILRPSSVESLRLSYSYIDDSGHRCSELIYGRNPAVLCGSGSQVPMLRLPKEMTGEGVSEGRGRKKMISDRLLSPHLKRWYLYDILPTAKTDKPGPTASKRVPEAKTAVPGIWFALNARKKPVLGYTNQQGSKTTRSISRYGLSDAWKTAVRELRGDYSDEHRKSWEALAPTEADLERFITAKAKPIDPP